MTTSTQPVIPALEPQAPPVEASLPATSREGTLGATSDASPQEPSKFQMISIVISPIRSFLDRRKSTANQQTAPATGDQSITPHVTHLELQQRENQGMPPRRKIPWSFLLIVALPTILAFLYYGFMASDQYESTADFVIKTQQGGDTAPGLAGIMGMIGGGGHGGGSSMAMGDDAMVEAYVGSAQILKDLAPDIDLRQIYSNTEIDWISRLKSHPDFFRRLSGRKTIRTTSHEISDEDLLKYWKKKVEVIPGKAPGTSTLTVRAFTPQDAKLIADHVIALGERLVNKVSERAMRDAVVFAQKEVDLAHDRAMKAYDDLQAFQGKAKQVDPAGFAKARSEIQGKMEGDLATLQSQMEMLRKQLPDEAPGIQQIRTQVSALQEQLLVEKNRSTTASGGNSAAEVITEFGKKQLETDFASKDYLSALTALETARINANRQNRYLEAFDLPQLPDKPELPKRLYSMVTVLAVCLLLWGGWTLFIAGVKEHQY